MRSRSSARGRERIHVREVPEHEVDLERGHRAARVTGRRERGHREDRGPEVTSADLELAARSRRPEPALRTLAPASFLLAASGVSPDANPNHYTEGYPSPRSEERIRDRPATDRRGRRPCRRRCRSTARRPRHRSPHEERDHRHGERGRYRLRCRCRLDDRASRCPRLDSWSRSPRSTSSRASPAGRSMMTRSG